MSCTVCVNIPFVLGRCDYYGQGLRADVPPANRHAYLEALEAEARSTLPDIAAAGEAVRAIVLRNGALGTVEPDRLRHLLRVIAASAPLAPGCRLYAEADPGLVSTALIDELRTRDVRLAMLRFRYFTSDALESERIGRPCAALEMAKTRIVLDAAAFRVFDMQVLCGLAGQTEKTLLKTLRDATLMPGVVHCTLVAPRPPLAASEPETRALRATAEGFLREHGFAPYAPGHFAREGHELPFVQPDGLELGASPRPALPVVSLGTGGVSRLDTLTWENTADPATYVRAQGNAELITVRVEESAQ